MSWCDGPTERISSLVDTLTQPIAQSQDSYLKDTTDLITFCGKDEVDDFIEQANEFYPTIKFTAEISEKEITFLDTNVYKGHVF